MRDLRLARMVALSRLAAVAAAVALFGPVPAVGAARSQAVRASAVGAQRIAESMRFRADFGLNTHPAYVQDVIGNPANSGSEAVYGVSLTAAEQQYLASRESVVDATSALDDYGAGSGAGSYAGSYMDDQHHQVVGLFAGPEASVAFAVAKGRFAYPDQLVERDVAFSLLQLDSLQQRIDNDTTSGALGNAGINVTGTAVDVPTNRVQVWTDDVTEQVRGELAARYGPAVSVQQGTFTTGQAASRASVCQSTRDVKVRPLQAGLCIRPQKPPPSYCTNSFGVLDSFNGYIGPYVGMLTAGHCVKPPGAPPQFKSQRWRQGDNNSTFFVTRSRFVNGSDCDCAVIATSYGSQPAKITNKVFVSSGASQTIRHVQSPKKDKITEMVCFAGATSGVHCGKLTNKNFHPLVYDTVTRTTARLVKQRVLDIPCTGGDSGAPTYNGDVAKGIVSFAAGRKHLCGYSHIGYVAQQPGWGTVSIDTEGTMP